MSTDVVVVGSLNHDLTVMTPRLPRPGETVLGTGHYSDNGGKGANQAVAVARLGGSVAMVGLVGYDSHGHTLREALSREGVDLAGIGVDSETPTGLAVITVDSAAENTIVVSPGANQRLTPGHVDKHRELIAKATVTLAQLEVPLNVVEMVAKTVSGTFCLNPAPATQLPPGLLSRVDVLIPNRAELGVLAGVTEPESIDEVTHAVGLLDVDGSVVVTLGTDGALLVTDAGTVHVPAPRVDAVDPTGAGDAFCGALAEGLSHRLSLEAAVERAVVTGALATTRPGAQRGLPTAEEVERMLTG